MSESPLPQPMLASAPAPHRRRPRYRGKNPRRFDEKYKEHNPGRYSDTVAKVLASGKTPAGTHRPVMVAEILEKLRPQPGELAVDCTLGYGGHAQEIISRLQPGGRLLGLDADPIELPKTEARLRALGFGPEVFTAHRSNFAGLPQVLAVFFSSLSSPEGGKGQGEENQFNQQPLTPACIIHKPLAERRSGTGFTAGLRSKPVTDRRSTLSPIQSACEICGPAPEPACEVAQASWLADSPGVPPGIRAGSGTLPQLAAGMDCATPFMARVENPVSRFTGADVILADLGVSSMQIDDPARGFSVKLAGPLDMRMNPQRGQPASALLGKIQAAALADLLFEKADEPNAATLAAALAGKTFATTTALAKAIRAVQPRLNQEDSDLTVRRVFQALRIAVNDEFSALETWLRNLPACLNPGGRVAVLTFHSGEDRRVKKAFEAGLRDGVYAEVANEVIRPTSEERQANPRSAPAKLRWAQRVAA